MSTSVAVYPPCKPPPLLRCSGATVNSALQIPSPPPRIVTCNANIFEIVTLKPNPHIISIANLLQVPLKTCCLGYNLSYVLGKLQSLFACAHSELLRNAWNNREEEITILTICAITLLTIDIFSKMLIKEDSPFALLDGLSCHCVIFLFSLLSPEHNSSDRWKLVRSN